jgi:two-component sensor histidine kinase
VTLGLDGWLTRLKGRCYVAGEVRALAAPKILHAITPWLRGPGFSTRLFLVAFGAVIILPLLLFALFISLQYANIETKRAEQLAEQLASNIALLVEGELDRGLAILRGLAASNTLAAGDFAQFHEEARRALPDDATVIVLRDLGSRQIVNTQLPFGAELPPAIPLTAMEAETFRAGKPYVSNVYRSPISGETRYAVALPIRRNGRTELLLSLTAPATRIRDMLQMATPPNWISAVGDRNGIYIARSERHDEVTGQPGVKAYLDKAVGRSGHFRASNQWGVPLLAGYHNSEFSGWLIAANVPEAVVSAPFRRSLQFVGLAGALALGLSILAAYWIGRSFAVATRNLTGQAIALGEGRSVKPLETHIRELRLVGEALVSASEAITRRERERELLTNELNHRVKNTLATVQALAANTLKDASLAEARKALSTRIIALAKTHDILTQQNWAGAELKDIVADVSSGFGGEGRIVAQGPGIWLQPNTVMAVSLTLNELATNAAKYGALSSPKGRVAIEWRIEPDGALVIEWAEQGGPAVIPPSHRGFGMRLIESAFAGNDDGTAELAFASAGVRCTIRIPAAVFAASSGGAALQLSPSRIACVTDGS